MKTLKNMILESSKNVTSKKTIEVEVECELLKMSNVYSDWNVDYYNDEDDEDTYYKALGYSSPEEALVEEENEFGFTAIYELNLRVNGEIAGTCECTLHPTFTSENNDYWLNKRSTEVTFKGDILTGFNGEEIAKILYEALDKNDKLWSDLKDAFGYTGNEYPHELIYGSAFEDELCNYIEDDYNDFAR